ncbi:RICIN domain-containing protein [Solwaraspora sp. WMMA2065]|uniref:RICIN domain-containing protein n=1 Tax=Solwaraspora sp. WMMA2065 TaxID=3015166 RepID=UPI00259B774E|nr:RICIN domain-containing protein [Solwaraspora sp. WMMA2065]WJK32281.1 RICIN domain-containing protein [Solwaraspora sp. WMMA2065]
MTATRWRRWRTGVVALATTAMVATGAAVGVQYAAAATVDTGAWYVMLSRHSGKAIDLYGGATHDGAPIVQWTRNDSAAQQWQFVDVGSGYYKIRSRHSGKYLELPNAVDGAQLIQNYDNGSTRQHFRLADSDSGYVRFISRHSNKALDVWQWSTSDGGIISQYQDVNGWNQQWQMVRLDSSGGCGSGSFNAEAVQNGSTWTARNGGSTVYTGSSMLSAMQAAVNSLSAGRNSKQKVVVRGSGSISAGSRLSLPSYTVLEVCGTVNVTGSGSGDQAVVYARGVTDVEVTRLNITGNPLYGIFIRNGNNITLGQIDIRVTAGLGIRIDNHGDRSQRSRNVRIDNVYVQGTSNHGVETYGVDGLTVGTVTARNTGYSGLILNDTINATVGTVDAQGAGTGTGYAGFRMANRNGRVGDSYPTNIRVGTVIARGGGRGIFCVSESGGAVIDRIDISGTGSNSILLENCYNVTIAAVSGTVNGSDVRIASRTEFPVSRDITLQNLTLTNSQINENPCGQNIVIRNIALNNSTINRC